MQGFKRPLYTWKLRCLDIARICERNFDISHTMKINKIEFKIGFFDKNRSKTHFALYKAKWLDYLKT